MPGPQVHVKVRLQVQRACGCGSDAQSWPEGPPHLGAASPRPGSAAPASSAGRSDGFPAAKARPSPAAVAPPTFRLARGRLQLAAFSAEHIARCMDAGFCSLEPPTPSMRPPLPPGLRRCGGSPRSSAPRAPGPEPRWLYLRVGEIVEEEGGELFVQQRAAVVPRHLPAAAAACRGVTAEPAGGRELAS